MCGGFSHFFIGSYYMKLNGDQLQHKMVLVYQKWICDRKSKVTHFPAKFTLIMREKEVFPPQMA